jgi:hypothetical protein
MDADVSLIFLEEMNQMPMLGKAVASQMDKKPTAPKRGW